MIAIVDPIVEAEILAYHVGVEAELRAPRATIEEVERELELDLWTALQQGAL